MNIVLLGVTGSIGSMCLDLIKDNNFNLIGVSLGRDLEKSKEIVKNFKPKYICVRKDDDKAFFKGLCENIYSSDLGLIKNL